MISRFTQHSRVLLRPLSRYAHWLHTRWPAGTVERLPEVRPDGSTNVPGLYVAGDLTGIPLLKFSLDSGVRAVEAIAVRLKGAPGAAATNSASTSTSASAFDLIIVGAGLSGMAAALEAKHRGLRFLVIESAEPFFTILNFPKGKPIYTYPKAMTPKGRLRVTALVKEDLVRELREQTEPAGIPMEKGRVETVARRGDGFDVTTQAGRTLRARHVLVAIGRNGDFRRLHVPGEDRDKVTNRLHDPKDFCGKNALVVGGGDSALEAAIALAHCGARVTLSYRKEEFSRPKPENLETVMRLAAEPAVGHLTLALGTTVREIREREVILSGKSPRNAPDASPGSAPEKTGETRLPNDAVFVMIGREAPLDFFRRCGVRIAGEMRPRNWAALGLFMLFCTWLYNWKSGGFFAKLWEKHGWFPDNLPRVFARAAADPTSLVGIVVKSASGPSFWYTLAYSLVVTIFGIRRIRRRRTPYVTAQTLTLMGVQVLPLFLLPEIILPYLNYHGLLPHGIADALFPVVTYGHHREFWRAYGLILAWPLNVYNVFTDHPLPAWLVIAGLQTLVLIPLGIYFFGKGVYCGWVCSCGALAETLGDGYRHKMPHGPRWNRLNMLGQGILAVAVVLLVLRVLFWILPGGGGLGSFLRVAQDGGGAGGIFHLLNYKWMVDVLLAGVLGYGMYFWFSGRMWCRFACPLAALMHVYSRWSRFRILADKKKCISCNVCTTVCHQGIDVMNFANKGIPMSDPECVRCSACVEGCPTGVLSFGQVDGEGRVVSTDRLAASPVQMREGA